MKWKIIIPDNEKMSGTHIFKTKKSAIEFQTDYFMKNGIMFGIRKMY